jgi:hypothetical protein
MSKAMGNKKHWTKVLSQQFTGYPVATIYRALAQTLILTMASAMGRE